MALLIMLSFSPRLRLLRVGIESVVSRLVDGEAHDELGEIDLTAPSVVLLLHAKPGHVDGQIAT